MFYLEHHIANLTNSQSALVVNNNAAAIYLILNTLSKDKETIVSRGEMVEVGDSFRISEIIENSGAIIKEVGTTNKTNIDDYLKNTNENTKVYLKVHCSNYKIVGFTKSVTTKELCKNKLNKNILVVEDMGSGVLVNLNKIGLKNERTVKDAVNDGADIVCFSGDKLLGGPQSGIIVGKKELIDKMRKNQLLRCLRIDKMSLIALSETLKQYYNLENILNLPIFKCATLSLNEVKNKAENLIKLIKNKNLLFEVVKSDAMFGGGSLPEETIESYSISIKSKLLSSKKIEAILRMQEKPIITVIKNETVFINMRTVFENDFKFISKVLNDL